MKVLKFGGTSVGTAEAILNVKKIVESENENIIVVVSAMGGITDLLLQTAKAASEGDCTYADEFKEIYQRHFDTINKVVPDKNKDEVKKKIVHLFDELENILKGLFLIKDLSERTNDAIVSYGERLSSVIISGVIKDSVWYDARKFIKTSTHFNKHIVDFDLTNKLIGEAFNELPQVAVVQGFISTDKDTDEITNLGRGGSDYTAAILASRLGARQLEIWTDVDGFMTADSRVINNAYVIDNLSYVEAMELCNFGAKVIYPPTIFPAYHANIPIVIKNTFNPEAKGTFISRDRTHDQSKAIKGISSINDTCLITVQGMGMVGIIGVNYRIFKALAKAGISVFFVSQASSENTISIGVKNGDADIAIKVLSDEFVQEIELGEINKLKKEPNLATVAIVGDNMKHTPGIAGKLFGTLGVNGVNVIACAQGASETNISFVINIESLRKAMNVIHDSFFLSEYQVLNVFIAGTGLVGSNLLEQINMQQEKLKRDYALKINIVGITNSRKYILNREGIDLNTYKEELEKSENRATPEKFKEEILNMNIFNSVFVDCTASADVAAIYKDLLQHSVSVVTANKIAASSDYESYQELKKISRKRGIKFLFETNVGAGLPIINTIGDLINSGDKIIKIEAVVSGTLNYIFNVMDEKTPMSKAIKMAMEAGYAEPDPRIDLSGSDVIRKLVILSREAGYRIEQSDVVKNLFVPAKYFDGSLEDFWNNITALDREFEEKRTKLAADNKKWRFVAKLEDGKTEIGLREIESSHPFYHLEGSNNIVLLTTERYNEYPLQIKGYGAGASVTAAGVFADIISIANIR
ncbi:MAG: bifunctional aspartate kinase/homoserine dehydrogenase I [Rikenellaceae bacterium]|nr:bifunctional aspartate kinase/homoserine dehydrogenase I [Rikenellaceae bacterium]